MMTDKVSPLQNQVGGHLASDGKIGMLKTANLVLKPLQGGNRGEREAQFYERIFSPENKSPEEKSLISFVPQFHGRLKHIDHWYIKLEDVTSSFCHPSILDMKMGTQTWDEDATEEKRLTEEKKYPPQKTQGFRFVGMNIYQITTGKYKHYDRLFGRSLGVSLDIIEGFKGFLNSGKGWRMDVIPQIIAKLNELLEWFESQSSLRFYSASILFVYEGDPSAGSNVEVKFIDFAHVFPIKEANGRDTGFIFGLKNLIHQFQEFLECPPPYP